jgi:hypothetical protein
MLQTMPDSPVSAVSNPEIAQMLRCVTRHIEIFAAPEALHPIPGGANTTEMVFRVTEIKLHLLEDIK